MPTLKYGNVKNVETDFKQAPIGVYRLKAVEVGPKSNDNGEMVEVKFLPTHDAEGKKLKDTYSNIFYYAPLSVDEWGGEQPHPSWLRRLKELVLAFGLKETGGDMSKIEGKTCLGRLVKDEDQDGEYRPKIGKLMSLKARQEDEEAEDEEPDEDEESEDEDEGDEVDLDEMDRDELKSFIKEQELGIRVLSKYTDDEVRDKIREALGDDEDEEEEDEEEEDEEEGVDLDELDRKELKAFIEENELDIKVLKKWSDDELRAKIQEALGEDEDEDEEEEEDEDEEGDNYDEMSLAELREELENRELDTKGKKNILVARLRKDDQTDPV
jgi:hypothetical protein